MTIEYLKTLTTQELLELDESTYHKETKWDYESDEFHDEEWDEYEMVVKLQWLNNRKIVYETIFDCESECILRKDDFVIILDSLADEVHIFDDSMLCDGVVEGYFNFDSYQLINGWLERIGSFIK
jgi:hypothetical protein